MKREREWTVLLIGGASGTGKSSLAYALAREYGVNVLEIDDIVQALKALTGGDALPALHYWEQGRDWLSAGVEANVQWLIDVSRELAPGIRSIIEDHLETGVPVIIEGDFLDPAMARAFEEPGVRALYVDEPEREQIIRNYLAREGGAAQDYRAEISAAYGEWIRGQGAPVIAARPWDSLVDRAAERLACPSEG